MRRLAIVAASAILLAACARPGAVAPTVDADESAVAATPAPTAAPDAKPAPTSTPEIRLYKKLRVFVASESTDQVWVMEAAPTAEFTTVAKIPVGRMPHQAAVSPDGRFVAVNNRMGNTTSIIDPVVMKEIARIPVGKQPHGITFSTDSKTLYVGHERDSFISVIDTATWIPQGAIMVMVPQHVLTINPGNPNELWFTVTNANETDVLRVIDLTTRQITRIKVGDVHDAYFTPDGSEVWSSSSGFLEKPSDRMVIYDPVAKTVKQEIHFPGRYPFHSFKPMQDGMYRPEITNLMILSDHLGPSLLWVDWRERRIVAETKLGKQPFHSTYDPEGERLLVTTNADGMVNVINMKTKQVIQQIPVTKPHGIVSVGIRAGP